MKRLFILYILFGFLINGIFLWFLFPWMGDVGIFYFLITILFSIAFGYLLLLLSKKLLIGWQKNLIFSLLLTIQTYFQLSILPQTFVSIYLLIQ